LFYDIFQGCEMVQCYALCSILVIRQELDTIGALAQNKWENHGKYSGSPDCNRQVVYL